jgi:protein TonB
MATYADRYRGGLQFKPGSLALALATTVLPIAGLVAGLNIAKIVRDPGRMKIWDVKETPPPPPDQTTKLKPQIPPREQIFIPPVPPPPIPQSDPIDYTPTKPMTPPGFNPIGTALPDPTPVAPPDPIKPPVIVAAQIASMSALQPPYPSDMIRGQQEGRVVVRVLIGTDGRVRQVERVSATNDSFYGAVERQATTRWRFKPATKDGVPFEQWKTMSLRFQLDGE